MSLKFDPVTGLYVSDVAEIRDGIAQSWKVAFSGGSLPELNTEAETPAGQVIDSQTALVSEKDADLLFLANQFNPMTAEGRWQDALGKIYFIERKTAEPTVVDCTCTGLYGTVIPAGSIVQSLNGRQFRSLGDSTIGENGTVHIEFECLDSGAVPVSANTVTKIVTVIAGWDTVNNESAGVTGREQESRIDFEKRRYDSVAINARGSTYAIYSAIAALDGVLDLAVIENSTDQSQTVSGLTLTPHSVCCSVFGGTNDDIAEAIYRKKPAGCGTCGNTTITYQDPDFPVLNSYKIHRPTATPIKIVVQLDTASGSLNDVVSTIKGALIDDFYGRGDNSRVSMNATLYVSRFYSVLTKLGISALVMATVAIGSGTAGNSVFIPANIEPTLSEDDISVTFNGS